MKKLPIIAGIGFFAIGSMGSAQAQQYPVSGTPESPFPHAAPHEVEIIDGVPCRTVLHPDGNRRVVVACSEPGTTGSVTSAPGQGMRMQVMPQAGGISGTPGSAFPYAAPHEIRIINGVPCRTVFDRQTQSRVVVACER